MSIRLFLPDQSFDPETVEILHAAYITVCADLGLSGRTDRATEMVAKKVIELASDGERDPKELRTAALASLRRGAA